MTEGCHDDDDDDDAGSEMSDVLYISLPCFSLLLIFVYIF